MITILIQIIPLAWQKASFADRCKNGRFYAIVTFQVIDYKGVFTLSLL